MGALHTILIVGGCGYDLFDLSECSPGLHLALSPLSFLALVFLVDHVFDTRQVQDVEIEAILHDHLCLSGTTFKFGDAEKH